MQDFLDDSVTAQLSRIERERLQLEYDRISVVEKALSSTNVDDMLKAHAVLKDIEERHKSEHRAVILDPHQLNSGFGFRDKMYQITYEMLNRMAATPIINAIIKTRVNQIASFSNPQYDRHSVGFIIRKKQPHFFKKVDKLSLMEEKEIESLTDFVLRCGKNDSWVADDFDTFLRNITRDSFVYDQFNFQVLFDKKGEPYEFIAIDARSIRLAESYDDDTYEKKGVVPYKGYYPSYVQIYQNRILQDFYPWELCFGVRNPSTEMYNRGYGKSELEELVNIVTALLFSEEYNRKFFSQGASPKGIIALKGNGLSADNLSKFKQEWLSGVAGVQNAWKTPVIESDNVQWIDLQKSNQDMEFSKWIEYLIKISSAIYSIDPAEVNFPFSGGDSKPLFEGNNEARLKFSRDKGLKPALKLIASKLNRYLINHFYGGKYEFRFVGLESSTMQEETDLLIKQINNFKTINEGRREFNLPEIEGGDIILNATYLSKMQMDQQAELQAQQMAMANPDGVAAVPGDGPDTDKDSDRAAGGANDMNPTEGGDSSEDTTDGVNPFSKALNKLLNKF